MYWKGALSEFKGTSGTRWTTRDATWQSHTTRRTLTYGGGKRQRHNRHAGSCLKTLRERPLIGQWGEKLPVDWLLQRVVRMAVVGGNYSILITKWRSQTWLADKGTVWEDWIWLAKRMEVSFCLLIFVQLWIWLWSGRLCHHHLSAKRFTVCKKRN